MTRLNKNQRDKLYPLVENKEIILNLFTNNSAMNTGPYCRGCGKPVFKDLPSDDDDGRQGVIDCIKNDGDHSSIELLQLLCRSCNRIKNPKKPDSMKFLQMSHSEKKNLITETRVRGWLIKQVAENKGRYELDDAKNAAAEKYNCSPMTTTRYLEKMTSSQGPFDIAGEYLIFKTNEDIDHWITDTNEEDE